MVAIPFINKTRKTKFKGTFNLDSIDYEYTLYLLPITKQKEYNEIVNYFGNRMFKGSVCLEVDESAVEDYLDNGDVSAFIMINPSNIDNVASGTLQIYDWCNSSSKSSSSKSSSSKSSSSKSSSSKSSSSKSSSSKSSSKSPSIDDADVWINDVCRVSSSSNTGNPLKALFYFMEQLTIQNLHKNNIKLYIENEPDNVKVLKPKYESLGFVKNMIQNPEICPNWTGTEIVMEKSGLTEETPVIDFSFLQSSSKSVTAKSVTARYTTVKGKGTNKTYKLNHRSYKRNKKSYKRK
jgi:hypothetical protein